MVKGREFVMQEFVVKDPAIASGAPTIKGTRIKVADVAIEFEHLNKSPDEIVAAHPHLTLAQIHAALAYYYDHISEIKAEIEADETFVSELKQKLGH